MGNIYSLGKNIIWLDCYETSQELSLECVDVHIGFDIFKMVTKICSYWEHIPKSWLVDFGFHRNGSHLSTIKDSVNECVSIKMNKQFSKPVSYEVSETLSNY
jgi:hypothetical protein